MNSPASDNTRASTPFVPAFPVTAAGAGRPVWGAVEREANAAAADWQIVLHLKALFAQRPELITALSREPDGGQSDSCARALLAAACEALATRPDSAELHCHTARLAMHTGGMQQAETLLRRALELDPSHADAVRLLAVVDAQQRLAQGAGGATHHATIPEGYDRERK